MTTNPSCQCGKPLKEATFLSESFGYDGGTMVFTCDCGQETRRDFAPFDMLTEDAKIDFLLQFSGLDKDMIPIAKAHYKANHALNKIKRFDPR